MTETRPVDDATDRRGRQSELMGFTAFLNDPKRHTDPALVKTIANVIFQLLEWRGTFTDPDTRLTFKNDVDKGKIPPWWAKWDFKAIRADVTTMLTEDGLDEDPIVAKELADFQESLLKLETEWRAEMAASKTAGEKLGIADGVASALSWRGGALSPTNCEYVASTGTPCKTAPVPGTTRCLKHGGALIHEDVRRAVLMNSYLMLVEATGIAVEALVDVAQHSRNDLARVAASKEILDRAGMTPELEISITLDKDGKAGRLDELREKLDGIQGVLTRNAGLPESAGRAPAAAEQTQPEKDELLRLAEEAARVRIENEHAIEAIAEEKPVPSPEPAPRFDPLAPGEGFH